MGMNWTWLVAIWNEFVLYLLAVSKQFTLFIGISLKNQEEKEWIGKFSNSLRLQLQIALYLVEYRDLFDASGFWLFVHRLIFHINWSMK